MSAFETYIRDLKEIRATGAAVKETSYYGALEKLLNELGKTLKPKVRCVIHSTEWNKEGIQVGTAIGLFVKQEGCVSSQLGEQQDSPSSPDPFSHSGEKGSKSSVSRSGVGGDLERWEVSRELEVRMLEVARLFRKEPTLSEAILWKALRRQQVDGRKFRRQQPIGRFVVDFFCASERLIVEVDGGIHDSQRDLDGQRQKLLESLGLRFLRVSSEQVETNLADVLRLIRAAFSHSLSLADAASVMGEAGNHPLPLTPSPIEGEGESESAVVDVNADADMNVHISLTPSPLVGEGAGGEGVMSQQRPIKFRDLWGVTKWQQLVDSQDQTGKSLYQEVKPAIALGLPLKPRKFNTSYPDYPLLPELFPTFFPGVQTKRDELVVDIDKSVLKNRIEKYFDSSISNVEMADICPRAIESTAQFDAIKARNYLLSRGFLPQYIVRHCYRPFDLRWLYWEPEAGLLGRRVPEYFPQIFDGNVWIIAQHKPRREWSKPQFIRSIGCIDLMDRGASCIPLFLKPEEGKLDLFSNDDRKLENGLNLNLSDKAVKYLKNIGTIADAEHLFYHVLAILHAPNYASENDGALRQDWARIPLPDRRETLITSATLGRQIAAFLDPETPVAGVTSGKIRPELKTIAVVSRTVTGNLDPNTDFALTAGWGHAGQNGVTMPGRGKVIDRDYLPEEPLSPKPSPTRGEGLLGAATHDIYLNDIAYWKNIPDRVWSYTIGGYQVIKKWLSYRELELLGRSLKQEEVIEVTQMARRIAAILLLEPEWVHPT